MECVWRRLQSPDCILSAIIVFNNDCICVKKICKHEIICQLQHQKIFFNWLDLWNNSRKRCITLINCEILHVKYDYFLIFQHIVFCSQLVIWFNLSSMFHSRIKLTLLLWTSFFPEFPWWKVIV